MCSRDACMLPRVRGFDLRSSKKDGQVASGEVKVKRRLSLSSLASTLRRRSFRAPKTAVVTTAPVPGPTPAPPAQAPAPVGRSHLSSNPRNVRLSSLAVRVPLPLPFTLLKSARGRWYELPTSDRG